VVFPPLTPFTLHVTSALRVPFPVTITVNSCAPAAGTLALVGAIDTLISGGVGGGGGFAPGGVPAVPQPCCNIALQQIARQISNPERCLLRIRVVLNVFTCETINARSVPHWSRG
jgi:hypothetical protein